MTYDYGYGTLEDKLISLFRSGAPDFEAAEELIRLGADVNAMGPADDENILSEILFGYYWSKHGDKISDACAHCNQTHCQDCKHNLDLNPHLGPSMCAIIRFFLAHGFDVSKCDGCYGAQCLLALTHSTYDRFMIEGTKLLLDAGAKNRTVSPTSTDADDTPLGCISAEGSFQGIVEHRHSSANIYQAIYQIYQAIEGGKSYGGIDSYEIAVGKKIQKVLVEKKDGQPIFFSMDLPGFQKDHCFTQPLYFVYEGGALITTQYADFWTDTVLPNIDLVDVSEYFEGIVGNVIQRFVYDHRSVIKGTDHYGQPITTIEMDSGHRIRFSINFGEVEAEARAAFYELLGNA